MKDTKIIWFTGLSGSGKTTIVNLIVKELESLKKTFRVFDGDDVRERFHSHLGFSAEDILENNRLIAKLCEEEFGKVDYILVPVISPFRESREYSRKLFGSSFFEVFVDCPYEVCKKRDVKGLYLKAENGEIENFIGLHVPYEKPLAPEIVVKSFEESPYESAQKILIELLVRPERDLNL